MTMVRAAGVMVNPSAVAVMLMRSAGSAAVSVLMLIVNVPVPADDPAGMVIVVRRLPIR